MTNATESKIDLLRKYFIEPIGWMLMAAYALLFLLAHFQIIVTNSIISFDYLGIIIIPLFTYSISERTKTLTHKWIARIHSLSTYIFCLSLSALAYIFIAGFEWSRYAQQNLFRSSPKLDWLLLFTLYISSFLTLSLSDSLDKILPAKVANKEKGDAIEKKDKADWLKISHFVRYSLILAIVFMVSMLLRIRQLPDLSLWVDEATTVLVARQIIDGNGQYLLNGDLYDRALIYHHYLAWFMERFHAFGLYTVTRIANTPFFIVAFLGIFFLGSYVYSRRTGVIATILFSFSWVSISMFREARFYEMFIALFILLCFLLIYLDDLLIHTNIYEKGVFYFKKADWNYGQKILLTLIALGAVGYLCIDTQEIIGFILYPLILVGILIWIFNRDVKALIITGLSFSVLLLKRAYDADFHFHWIDLIKYPDPAWKLLEPNYPFSQFWNYLMVNQFSYLIGIGVLVVPLLFIKYNRRALYVLAITVGWYVMVALQGYNEQVIRYFYPSLPVLTITIGYVFENYHQALRKFIPRSIFTFLLLLLIGMTVYGGWVESGSAAELNSRNIPKNSNYDAAIDFLLNSGSYRVATMMTDDTFSMSYYLTFESAPDYVVLNTDLYAPAPDNIEPYTAAPEIDYRQIPNVPKPAYYVFNDQVTRVGANMTSYLESIGGQLVYKDSGRLIYFFPAATSSKTTVPTVFTPKGIDR